MDCDKGNKTEIFHKAQRWSGGEHDDEIQTPLGNCMCPCLRKKKAANRGGGGTDVACATCMCG